MLVRIEDTLALLAPALEKTAPLLKFRRLSCRTFLKSLLVVKHEGTVAYARGSDLFCEFLGPVCIQFLQALEPDFALDFGGYVGREVSMPAHFDELDFFGTMPDGKFSAGYAHFRRGFESMLECADAKRLDLLVPRFREFLEFCEGRTFTPEAQRLVDILRRMIADLNNEV